MRKPLAGNKPTAKSGPNNTTIRKAPYCAITLMVRGALSMKRNYPKAVQLQSKQTSLSSKN